VLSKKIEKVNSLKLDFDNDFDKSSQKAQSILQDWPTFTLKVLNATKTDSVYGWYADYSCFAKFKLLDNNGWFYGPAQKCFYWTNISTFQFFKSHENYTRDLNPKNEIENIYPEPENINVLSFLNVRLFDNNKYLITYDNKGKSIKLEQLK